MKQKIESEGNALSNEINHKQYPIMKSFPISLHMESRIKTEKWNHLSDAPMQ